jgi:hypothetical protein
MISKGVFEVIYELDLAIQTSPDSPTRQPGVVGSPRQPREISNQNKRQSFLKFNVVSLMA